MRVCCGVLCWKTSVCCCLVLCPRLLCSLAHVRHLRWCLPQQRNCNTATLSPGRYCCGTHVLTHGHGPRCTCRWHSTTIVCLVWAWKDIQGCHAKRGFTHHQHSPNQWLPRNGGSFASDIFVPSLCGSWRVMSCVQGWLAAWCLEVWVDPRNLHLQHAPDCLSQSLSNAMCSLLLFRYLALRPAVRPCVSHCLSRSLSNDMCP